MENTTNKYECPNCGTFLVLGRVWLCSVCGAEYRLKGPAELGDVPMNESSSFLDILETLAVQMKSRVWLHWNDSMQKIQCKIEDAFIHECGGLLGAWGKGDSKEDAARDYYCQIRDKCLTFNAMRPDKRREYKVCGTDAEALQ